MVFRDGSSERPQTSELLNLRPEPQNLSSRLQNSYTPGIEIGMSVVAALFSSGGGAPRGGAIGKAAALAQLLCHHPVGRDIEGCNGERPGSAGSNQGLAAWRSPFPSPWPLRRPGLSRPSTATACTHLYMADPLHPEPETTLTTADTHRCFPHAPQGLFEPRRYGSHSEHDQCQRHTTALCAHFASLPHGFSAV